MKELWNMQRLTSAIYEILPNAVFDVDDSGEIIVCTGYTIISSDMHIAPIKEDL